MISGGLLRWTATRLAPSTTRDGLGMRVDTWTAGGTFRADLRESGATETPYADGVVVRRNVEVRARWQAVQNTGLSEVDRLEIRGRTFRIQSILNLDESDRVAVIAAEEID